MRRKGKPLTDEDLDKLRALGRGAVVLIISDGWDRGDVDLLKQEMSRLKRNCLRLIWLNRLLGAPACEALTRGIQAALLHAHDFPPVHNLASLKDLADRLADLNRRSNGGNHARYPA